MSVLDSYLVDPKLLLLDKTRIQAQVLVLRALRSELGREKLTRLSASFARLVETAVRSHRRHH
jgi:hypothetical protein